MTTAHQRDSRIEAHIFVAFIADCMQVTLKHRLRGLAPGLTPRAVLEKMAAMQRVDVHLPTTQADDHGATSDSAALHRAAPSRAGPHRAGPGRDQQLLLDHLQLQLPEQPPPRIRSAGRMAREAAVVL